MHATQVIRRPHVTEKSTFSMNEENRYVFEVDRRASKGQVKAAVEELYKVKVLGVTTQVRKGAQKRTRFGLTSPRITKIATVRLGEEQKIDFI